MKKWMRNIKLIIAVSTMLAMFAIAPIVHGGISWTGIDPIFLVKDHQFNVIIKWPEQYTCSIEDPIDVTIRMPKNSPYVFISESSDDVGDCGPPQPTTTNPSAHRGAPGYPRQAATSGKNASSSRRVRG